MAEAIAAGAGVAAALFQAKTTIWDPLRQTISASNDLDEIYESLNEAVEMLHAKRADHQDVVSKFKTTKKTSNTYDNWSRKVLKVEDEVKTLMSEYKKKRRRSRFFCIRPRSNFSEKMKKKGLQVLNYVEEGNQLGDFLIDKEPACVVKMIAPEIEGIPTLQGPLERILGWLSNPKVTGIRIHGLVGSGKTAIMQNLNNNDKVAEMFNIVIWVTVSREGSKENFSVEQLQQAIAQRLNFNREDSSHTNKVASTLREELQSKKYLLLLDDVKEDLNLHQIGIPIGNSGSKIVFTTRLRHVCFSIANRHTNVAKLNKKESLNMFKNVLGRTDLEENPNINRLMPSVVNLCGYHPLMIKVAAGAFRVKETEESWHDGLKNLRKWPAKGDDSMSEMFKLLNFCCDYLTGPRRKCFFYSAMYPEDTEIDKNCLLDNWTAEDLLGSNHDDEDESRVNGRDTLEYLKMVSLFEESVCRHYIRIHKLIRQVALYNLSVDEECKNLVKSGEALYKLPSVEYWTEKRWISLIDSKLDTLPDKPDCSMLSTLLLQKNPNLKTIPTAFFQEMKSLRVLDLYCTGIASLPLSLLKLASIKVLYLRGCVDLVELPSEINELQQLEVLDIRGSGLYNIPPQIGSLIRLRRLLVSFIVFGNRNDNQTLLSNCQVISKISNLKELVIDVKVEFHILLSGVIIHIDTLTKLSALQFCYENEIIDVIKVVDGAPKIYFPREDNLKSFFQRKDNFDFTSFQVFVGGHLSSLPQIPKFSRYQRYVRYCDGNIDGSHPAISKMLCNADAFELINHKELEHLSSFEAGSTNQIRGCFIESCNKIRTIVDGNHVTGSSFLPNLERLQVKNMQELKNIWEGPTQSMCKLKTLVLSNCPMLIGVCSYGVILQLSEIQHLEVSNCAGVEEIITESGNVGPQIFPKLKKLILLDMPQLGSIFANDSLKWPSLEKLSIHGCPKLKILPLRTDSGLKLNCIETEKNWWEALENPKEVKDHFEQNCTFRI